MTNLAVDLVSTGDDEERRKRRRDRSRGAISGLLFIGTLFALLSSAEPPGTSSTETTQTARVETSPPAIPPPPPVTVDPAAIDFGAIAVGASATQPVAFNNPGASAFVTAGVTGVLTPTDFTISAEKCARIAPNDFCVATITFTPHSAGPQTATFTLRAESNASLPVSVNGSGVALAGLLEFPESELSLGSHRIGVASQRTATIINRGNGPLAIKTLTSGDPQFTVAGCEGTTLPAGASCDATIEFRPQTRGKIATTLTATDDSGKSATTNVSGAGTLHMLRTTTPLLNLKQGQGKVATVTFENSGDDVVTFAGPATITRGPYTILADGCVKRQQLQPGENCTIDIASYGSTGVATLTLSGDGVEASATLNSGGRIDFRPKRFVVPKAMSTNATP